MTPPTASERSKQQPFLIIGCDASDARQQQQHERSKNSNALCGIQSSERFDSDEDDDAASVAKPMFVECRVDDHVRNNYEDHQEHSNYFPSLRKEQINPRQGAQDDAEGEGRRGGRPRISCDNDGVNISLPGCTKPDMDMMKLSMDRIGNMAERSMNNIGKIKIGNPADLITCPKRRCVDDDDEVPSIEVEIQHLEPVETMETSSPRHYYYQQRPLQPETQKQQSAPDMSKQLHSFMAACFKTRNMMGSSAFSGTSEEQNQQFENGQQSSSSYYVPPSNQQYFDPQPCHLGSGQQAHMTNNPTVKVVVRRHRKGSNSSEKSLLDTSPSSSSETTALLEALTQNSINLTQTDSSIEDPIERERLRHEDPSMMMSIQNYRSTMEEDLVQLPSSLEPLQFDQTPRNSHRHRPPYPEASTTPRRVEMNGDDRPCNNQHNTRHKRNEDRGFDRYASNGTLDDVDEDDHSMGPYPVIEDDMSDGMVSSYVTTPYPFSVAPFPPSPISTIVNGVFLEDDSVVDVDDDGDQHILKGLNNRASEEEVPAPVDVTRDKSWDSVKSWEVDCHEQVQLIMLEQQQKQIERLEGLQNILQRELQCKANELALEEWRRHRAEELQSAQKEELEVMQTQLAEARALLLEASGLQLSHVAPSPLDQNQKLSTTKVLEDIKTKSKKKKIPRQPRLIVRILANLLLFFLLGGVTMMICTLGMAWKGDAKELSPTGKGAIIDRVQQYFSSSPPVEATEAIIDWVFLLSAPSAIAEACKGILRDHVRWWP